MGLQFAAEGAAEFGGGRWGGRVPGDDVGGEPLFAGLRLLHDDDRLADGGVALQRRLDVPQFDAVAADLHLEVAAAE